MHASIEPEVILRYAVKGLNDSMGPNGLVPSLLIFGTLQSFPMTTANTTEQKVSIEMMQTARSEVAQIRAEQRIATAIKAKVPPSAKFRLKQGDIVMAYSEAERKWKNGC